MPFRSTPLWNVARFCGDAVLTLGCWFVWLALGLLLVLQIVVTVNREFQVPRPLLQAIEERFAASQVEARFGRTLLDPTGGVLLQDVRLSLPQFTEPVIVIRAVYVELEPWPLLLGRVEARRVHATGVKLFTPAMLSPSGRSEEQLSDLEFDVDTGDQRLDLHYLTARLAGVSIAAHGGLQLPRREPTGPISPVPLLENIARHYVAFTRQLLQVAQLLQAVGGPQLEVSLAPSAARSAVAAVTLVARSVDLPGARGLHARELRLETQVPLTGAAAATVPFTLTAADAAVAGAEAHGIQLRGAGRFSPGRLHFQPQQVDVAVERAAARGFGAGPVAGHFELGAFPRVVGRLMAEYEGAPLFAQGGADVTAGTAAAHVEGRVSPVLLTPLGAMLHRDVRRFVDFGEPVDVDVDATFGAGWKFTGLAGHVAATKIHAYHVEMDAVSGEITFDGRHFTARHAYATIGPNLARGSFEQDLQTQEFRFLLEGRLRPLDIGGWFHSWWPEFFEHFEFPSAPPDASVDVAGRWKAGEETTVFLYAQSGAPVIRGAKLDYARTLMFIRPNFIDALELYGTRDGGEVRGTFTLVHELGSPMLASSNLSFAFVSSIDLATGEKLLGPAVAAQLQPFAFEHPPRVDVTGRLQGDAAAADAEPGAGPGHRSIRIEAHSAGAFTAYGLSGTGLKFEAKLTDDDVAVPHFKAGIAGGAVSGQARVWGPPAARRLGFDAYVKGASLADAITVAADYVARRHGAKRAAAEEFLTGRNNAKLDVALSAEGLLADPYTFQGSGNASLAGTELGEVRLLGLLSELLNFTALRFTGARADFKLQGDRIVFPSVNVTGANSAIHAHGDYSLQRHALDFNARVYPFEESKSFFQSIMGAVLTPVSAVLEVKLTGALDQPKWAFVIGPTNLLNSLSQPAPSRVPYRMAETAPTPEPETRPVPAKTN